MDVFDFFKAKMNVNTSKKSEECMFFLHAFSKNTAFKLMLLCTVRKLLLHSSIETNRYLNP